MVVQKGPHVLSKALGWEEQGRLENWEAGLYDWGAAGVAGDETSKVDPTACLHQQSSVSPLESVKYRKAVSHFLEAPALEVKHGS